MIDRRYGIPVVHHGGDIAGYHSDMIWLPDYGVGAVFLRTPTRAWSSGAAPPETSGGTVRRKPEARRC